MIVEVDCPLHRLRPSSSGTCGLPSTLYLSFDDPSLTTGISFAARSDILSAFVALVAQARELRSGKPFNGLDTFGLDKSRLRLTNLPSPMRGRRVGDQGSAHD
jgi:hypothetical protein